MSASRPRPVGLRNESSSAAPEESGPDPRARACLTCRRSKHKCNPSKTDPDRCLRCVKRNEPCEYTIRQRKLEWQEWAGAEIKTLTNRVKDLEQQLSEIRKLLNGGSNGPSTTDSSNSGQGSNTLISIPSNPTQNISFDNSSLVSRSVSSTLLPSPQEIRSIPTTSTTTLTFPSNDINMSSDGGRGQESSIVGSSTIDQVWSQADNNQQVGLSPYMLMDSRAMDTGAFLRDLGDYTGGHAQSQLRSTVGSNDPRSNVVKKGLLLNEHVEVLLNHFLSFASTGLYGLILSDTTFPFLPEGQSAMTPYLLAVMLLIAAERYPAFHYLVPLLASEVSVANPSDLMSGDDNDEVDPELGIGPEEIMGAAIYASYSTDPGSASVAKAAHKWALWFYNLPVPEARGLTLGEMCGLLSPARPLERQDGLRMVLFTYIVSIHQVVYHRSTPPPPVDLSLCTELLSLSPQLTDQQSLADQLLVSHANLAFIMHRWRNIEIQHTSTIRGTPSLSEIEGVNAMLDDWFRTTCPDEPVLSMVWAYYKLLINTLGMIDQDKRKAEPFQRRAMDSAARLIGIARGQILNIAYQTPFYVEMIRVGCTMINLSLLRYPTWPAIQEDLNLIANMEVISTAMTQASLSNNHATICSGKELQNALNGLKRKWTG